MVILSEIPIFVKLFFLMTSDYFTADRQAAGKQVSRRLASAGYDEISGA